MICTVMPSSMQMQAQQKRLKDVECAGCLGVCGRSQTALCASLAGRQVAWLPTSSTCLSALTSPSAPSRTSWCTPLSALVPHSSAPAQHARTVGPSMAGRSLVVHCPCLCWVHASLPGVQAEMHACLPGVQAKMQRPWTLHLPHAYSSMSGMPDHRRHRLICAKAPSLRKAPCVPACARSTGRR